MIRTLAAFLASLMLAACIPVDNPVIESDGTPDVTECGQIPGVMDGRDYVARDAVAGADGRLHPDVFYIGWSTLDKRNDLRFPAKGYSGDGFEDKLLVSRKADDGSVASWQLLPMLDETCQDVEKIRIHSFDVAPDGRSLYVSMRRDSDSHLTIYEFDFVSYSFNKITSDDEADFMNPTYIGDHQQTGHRMLFVAKTVDATEIPLNYGGPDGGTLLDEYDRAATPLIHSLDVDTGDVRRIGLNNSHQTEPLLVTRPDGQRLVVFTQWEHQQSTNRFSLWKLQVDGSDNFTFYGQESATDRSGANIFQAREIKSGPYQGYILMGQGRGSFIADGSIAMTYRDHLDLRSARIFLEQHDKSTGMDIARNPEHYNDDSMVYSFRPTQDYAYGIYLKDYPAAVTGDTTIGLRTELMSDHNFHFVQPRSYYPPQRAVAAPGQGSIGESRTSFTNDNLNGRSGFLVQDLTQSDNGVQHQLDGIAPSEVSMQFFIPSHSFPGSQAIGKLGWGGSPELSVPASGFINPESDGSVGVIMKPGLYVWKMNKRFDYNGTDVWVPVRAERQEISFVPNRVNACNQCHQERDQANIEKYEDKTTIASDKMLGDLSDVPDISTYNAHYSVPDFHGEIMPMLLTCAGCHDARDKLDLSNPTGARAQSPAWLRLVRGAYNLDDGSGDVVPYVSNSINPMGFGNDYGPAPFLWSLLLGDDLTVPPAPGFPDEASRSIARPGDYGATYDPRITAAIADINAQYDHSNHWTAAEIQRFITYSTTQTMVGLSDRVDFEKDGSGYTSSEAGQKAYQAIARRCFDCHNNHKDVGIEGPGYGLPQKKRFRSRNDIKSKYLRLVVDSHLANKDDTKYSQFRWQSDLNASMRNTLSSARDRINFDDPGESQLLVFARCDNLAADVDHPVCLTPGDPDYDAIATWAQGGVASNQPPAVDGSIGPIVIKEYDEPALVGPITWSDPDNELSQLFLNPGSSSEHVFNDTMLTLQYDSLTSAQIESYAILGDRGDREFEFVVSDGITNSEVQKVPVTVTSDYIVPQPEPDLPAFTAFYTVRTTGELRRIDETGSDQSVGFIAGYTPAFSTMYRRADRGWLYFVDQVAQTIHVVDENNANLIFNIPLDHSVHQQTDKHKQTVYLIWWRPAEYDDQGDMTRPGELQGLLESKHSDSMDGDFYVGLGDGNTSDPVVPEYRSRLPQAENALSVYVWRRATFMTQWVGDGIDNLNVLNLVTGKARNLGQFSFGARNYMGTDYAARDYWNVRAVLLSEDGAFYGFNKDLNSTATLFNFDPLEGVQVEVPLPAWLEDLLDHPENYGTPFVVVPPRS